MLAACTPPRTSKASSDGRAAHRLLEAVGIIQDRNWPLVRRMLDRTDERRNAADTMTTTEKVATREYADLLETLATHRYFLRFTVRDLTDEQAAQRTTASSLCLGGLIKHVASAEQNRRTPYRHRSPSDSKTMPISGLVPLASTKMAPSAILSASDR